MWTNKNVLVTGGASFISSHLVDTLLAKGAVVKVADDFSSGKMNNLDYPLRKVRSNVWDCLIFPFLRENQKKTVCQEAIEGAEVVFHLAALHGGRGYIDSQPAQCCTNMILDQLVFEEAQRAGVERICFASSACVYPSY